MSDKDLSDSMSNTLDLGGYAAQPCDNISYTSGVDSITLDMSSITTSTTVPYQWTTSGAQGSTYSYTTAAANGQYYISGTGTTNITSNGIDLGADADIKIGGKSFKSILSKIEDRLAILTPDPAKLEKFAALKKAYDHYKLMEKLCQEEDETK